MTDDIAEDQSASSNVARGTRHTAVSQVITQAVRFGTNVVLARLLTPDDFGVFAIALVVSMLLDQIKDLGTGLALVQRETVDDKLLNSVFYLNLALGLVLASGMYFTAGPVAILLGNPRAGPVLQVFAGITLVTSLNQIHNSLLRRNLRFYEIAVAASATAVITAIVSVGAAVAGLGYWAPVLGFAVGGVFGTILVWVYDPWRPRLTMSLTSLRSIWGFSFHLFLSNIVFFFFNQVDKFIVSHFLGSAPLGTYTIAQRTVTAPMASVGAVVSEVAVPAYSRRQDDLAGLRRGVIRSGRVVALITFPAMVGLALLAEPTVLVVFGPSWVGLVPIIWLFAPMAAVQSVAATSNQLLLAKGRSDWAFRWGIVYCVVLTAFEFVGVQWGVVGVAAAYAGGILLLTPFGLLLAFRLIEMRMKDYLRELVPHVWITVVMAAFVWAADRVVKAAGGPAWAELGIGLTVGVGVYAALVFLVRPPALADALLVLRERGK